LNQGNTFTKKERISLKKEIDLLFAEGKSFTIFPLRIIYANSQTASGARLALLTSVPKRKLRRAVHRNRVKRLIREAFRLNRKCLAETLENCNKTALVAFVFVGNEIPDFKTVETAVIKALYELSAQFTCEQS
jgi:ribonuclease P protein component